MIPSRFRLRVESSCRPVELHAWDGTDGQDRLDVIEQGVRELIRALASTRAELAEREARAVRETESLLLAAVEILDALERVFDNVDSREDEVTPVAAGWIANFRTVHRLLRSKLQERGVEPIEALNSEFDPHRHTAVETIVDPKQQDGTIVRELERGYVWDGRVLRKAEVVVAAGDPEER